MKIEFIENKWGVRIELRPETIDEAGQLLRFVKNAKAEKPSLYLSFSGSPVCRLSMSKIKETVQTNSIAPGR